MQEASKSGLTREEATTFVDHLHRTGVVFHLQVGAANLVFLDTKVITHTLSDLLDPTGKTVRTIVAEKTEKLRVRKREETIFLFSFFFFPPCRLCKRSLNNWNLEESWWSSSMRERPEKKKLFVSKKKLFVVTKGLIVLFVVSCGVLLLTCQPRPLW